ncbi:hypothetical protein [Streptomyces sp. NRRL F-5135]|uniref:hypothetical protein n=1 Tax=Streptomyces sp. NRRL F-5135 TaxID=1463858 RepID=UPI0004C66290|nr:hypothetical protein [Streptomyces sp. NRRL F-5135]
MPIDTFAALNAMLRAEVARADLAETRRRSSAVANRDVEAVVGVEGPTAETEPNRGGTTQ